MDLLGRSVEILREAGYTPGNVDITVICQTPKIGPVASAMAARLSGILGIDPGDVSVKGKTNEGMGWIGAREGLAVHAVALVEAL
jgi:2-C-methyl-D-erythritol 2,4-cyclodiphosphate synthase